MLTCLSPNGKGNDSCDIGRCTAEGIEALKRTYKASKPGVRTVSGSKAIGQILFMKPTDGMRYRDERLPSSTQMAVKLFRSYSQVNSSVEFPGLVYELKVYDRVVRLIQLYQMNPYFVQYYGSCADIDIYGFVKLIDGKIKDKKGKKLTTEFLQKVITRAFDYVADGYVFDLNGTLKKNPLNFQQKIRSKDLFSYIITERLENVKEFADMIDNGKNLGELRCALVQILSALLVMKYFQLAHNDLHDGNILYTRSAQKISRKFLFRRFDVTDPSRTELVGYVLNTNLTCLVYDWDLSYCKLLGENNYLKGDAGLAGASAENKFIQQKDFIKILMYWKYSPLIQRSSQEKVLLVSCIFPDVNSLNARKFLSYLQHLKTVDLMRLTLSEKKNLKIPDSFYAEMFPLEEILYRLVYTYNAVGGNSTTISPIYNIEDVQDKDKFEKVRCTLYDMDSQRIAQIIAENPVRP